MNMLRQWFAFCLCLQFGVATAAATDELARGGTIYSTHCVSCHGSNGQPDVESPLVKSLGIVPANLADTLLKSRGPVSAW